MRKTALILVGLMIVFSVAVLAQGTTTSTSTSTTTSTSGSMDKGMEKGMAKAKTSKWEHTSGEVTAVDATAMTLTVKAKSGDKNFKWDAKTAVSPKGSTPAVGDKVTVTTAKDSDMATKIAIHKAKAAKATKAEEKKPGDEKKPN